MLLASTGFIWAAVTNVPGPTASSDPFSVLLSYGPLGIMVVGFVTGLLVPGYLYKRIDGENDRLRRLIEDKVIPLVEQNSRVTEEAIDVIKNYNDIIKSRRIEGS